MNDEATFVPRHPSTAATTMPTTTVTTAATSATALAMAMAVTTTTTTTTTTMGITTTTTTVPMTAPSLAQSMRWRGPFIIFHLVLMNVPQQLHPASQATARRVEFFFCYPDIMPPPRSKREMEGAIFFTNEPFPSLASPSLRGGFVFFVF
jgi:hypothetical protein